MSDLALPPPVHHVIDGVYISGWRATLFPAELREAGITNVLKLYEDIPHFPADFDTLENTMEDGKFIELEKLRRGVNFIVEHVDAGEGVLVMCGAGISRSSTFVLAYMLERGYDLREAYKLLCEKHPDAQPHPELWRSLIKHYHLTYTEDDLRK